MENLRLEQYLEHIAKKLTTLPVLEQEREIAEIRQHLEMMIAGAQAKGASEESATTAAVRQFDRERRVGADLRRTKSRERLLGSVK